MAKRFTDQNKWDDPWFDELPLLYKMAWIYMCDKCDIAGFWKPSMRNICHSLGQIFSIEDLESAMSGRMIKTGDKYFIPSFIKFQNGELIANNNCHRAIISILKDNGLDERLEPLPSPCQAPAEGPCNGNGNGNGNGIVSITGVNTEYPTGDSLLERIISAGPSSWHEESMQATMQWSDWTKDIPKHWRDQLPELAAKYKVFTDARLKLKKIVPRSLRNWLQDSEYAKEIPVVMPERRRVVF